VCVCKCASVRARSPRLFSSAVQETLQSRINGALGQLTHATQVLNDTTGLDHTSQIDDLLEDIVRQQKEIATQHEALADQLGDTSRTVMLGINEGLTKTATARCVSPAVKLMVESQQEHQVDFAMLSSYFWKYVAHRPLLSANLESSSPLGIGCGHMHLAKH
jgi:hypothetical protein